jgi:hypothetical protein
MRTVDRFASCAGYAAAILALTLSLPASTTAAAPTSIRGSIGGKVFDSATKALLSDVTVGAQTVTGEESFEATTNATGAYFVENAPAAVYTFFLRSGGVDFPVHERMDVRVGMPFLLETCFAIDAEKKTASVLPECQSGFVEQARVATIGPMRFLLPPHFRDRDQGQDAPASADVPQAPSTIDHDGIECLSHEHFPQVDAGIRPGDMVQTSRVYFRSDKYPDFYYVEMTKEHPTVDDFEAILPKPGPETEHIIYYLESVDTNFDSLQTPEYSPEVIDADECSRRGPPAWYDGDPSIIVGATQTGAAAIPPGFQAVGITGFVNSLGVLSSVGGTAGGVVGSTAGAILVVAGGAAAAATGIVVATSGGQEASPPK